jgi:hypothetical protein
MEKRDKRRRVYTQEVKTEMVVLAEKHEKLVQLERELSWPFRGETSCPAATPGPALCREFFFCSSASGSPVPNRVKCTCGL